MHSLAILAKQAVETYIKGRKIISLSEDLPKEFLERRSGTFVTIMKNDELRGCIGTYLATKQNIAEEVIHNAITAATEDYRFGPILEEELPYLSYTVYILNEPELINDISELNPKKFGIIVKAGNKTGLLLPDLEGVDTISQQISIAYRKAGINPKQEKTAVYKFTVEKYR